VVMVPLVPASPPSLAVIVVATPAVVLVVNCTVAAPVLSVVLVAGANDPRESDFVHVTTRPLLLTGLLLASTSCAVIVTAVPATGLLLLEVTAQPTAGPGTKMTMHDPALGVV